MNETFDVVYRLLKWISKISGLSYREVNIIVYFIVIPSLFLYLISNILKRKTIIVGFLIVVALALFFIPDFEQFSSSLFDKSVDFLNWFDNIGLNYIQASVIICVVVPLLVILVLFYFKRSKGRTPTGKSTSKMH